MRNHFFGFVAHVGKTECFAAEFAVAGIDDEVVFFPQVARESAERRAPHSIPIYAIRVADDFHRFYHEHRVIGSDAQAFRLGLCRATQTVIARSLDLIGVDAPERM